MSRRIEIVVECEHGNVLCYYRTGEDDCGSHGKCADPSHYCPGGSRTTLDEPTDEMVERAAEAWKEARQSPIVNLAAARAALSAALGGEE
jgi:hypothetical protein